MRVIAYDNEVPERSDTAVVTVIVEIDASDPRFVPTGTSVTYNTIETQQVGFTLGFLSATDDDLRGVIVYEANSEYPGINFFDVNSTTGAVYIKQHLMTDVMANTEYIVSALQHLYSINFFITRAFLFIFDSSEISM